MFHATELYGQNARLFRTEPCRSSTLILCLCVCCQSSEISRLTAAPDFLFGPAKLKMRGS